MIKSSKYQENISLKKEFSYGDVLSFKHDLEDILVKNTIPIFDIRGKPCCRFKASSYDEIDSLFSKILDWFKGV